MDVGKWTENKIRYKIYLKSGIDVVVDDLLWIVHASVERSPQFVERSTISSNDVLDCLQRLNRVVISGLPGAGKTELAIQMAWNARDCRKYYKGIFWLNVASSTSFQAGVQDLARGMKLIDETQLVTVATKSEDIQEMVLQELNSSDHWLLVLDNLDEASLLKDFLPDQRDTRHVLITTPHRAMSSVLKLARLISIHWNRRKR